jgi:hypothetical protein
MSTKIQRTAFAEGLKVQRYVGSGGDNGYTKQRFAMFTMFLLPIGLHICERMPITIF